MSTEPDDLALLDQWRNGETDAGAVLFDRHFPTVFRFFRTKISGPVDDLVQRTFLVCIEGRDRIRGEAGFRGYLLGCARNTLFAEYRARKKLAVDADVGESSVLDLGPTPSSAAARKQEHELLLRGLRHLPLHQQIALELYYVEGLRGPELAAALDLPEGTVRSRLKRGLERLRTEVERIAASPALAMSTLTGLETWAGEIQAQLQAPSTT